MPVKVRNNFKKARTEIESRAQQFIVAAASVGAKWSMFYAPEEYGTLRNSQRIDTSQSGTVFTGTVSFNVSYAIHLERNPKWRPRPVALKKGPAWNADAKPGFLRHGFEDSEPQREIKQLEKIFKV